METIFVVNDIFKIMLNAVVCLCHWTGKFSIPPHYALLCDSPRQVKVFYGILYAPSGYIIASWGPEQVKY
jgi:hypothetical protein